MAGSERPVNVLSVSEFMQITTVMKWSRSTAHPGSEQTRGQLDPERVNFISRKERTLCTCEVVNRSYVNITKVSNFKITHPDASKKSTLSLRATHRPSGKKAVTDKISKSFCHSMTYNIACHLWIKLGRVALCLWEIDC